MQCLYALMSNDVSLILEFVTWFELATPSTLAVDNGLETFLC